MLQTKPRYEDIPQFQPHREAPIYRRFTRRYNCRENLALRSNNPLDAGYDVQAFNNMSFKINSEGPDMVINNIRIVMPLEMKMNYTAETETLQTLHPVAMAANESLAIPLMDDTRHPVMSAVAVSSAPMNAFRTVECYINGKRFTKNFKEYGATLEKCYASNDEQGFRDNNSLKPILVRDPFATSGHGINYVNTPFGVQPTYSVGHQNNAAFNLLRQNTGFVERCRDFQLGLMDVHGLSWQGDVFCKLDIGPFEVKSRGQDNSAWPYVNDLELKFVFDQSISQLEGQYQTNCYRQAKGMRAAYCSGLFEYGTPVNHFINNESFVSFGGAVSGTYKRGLWHSAKYPTMMALKWLRKPQIEIEWVEFRQMSPQYSLHAVEYELHKSAPFQLQAAITHNPTPIVSDVSKQLFLNARLTAVPTKIYVWAELIDAQKRAWYFGGCERFCELDNIRIRINQQVDLVANPTKIQLYNWFKEQTNNNLLYSTWKKSPVYVFSAAEIAHPEFLANTGGILTFQLDTDVKLTRLQYEELLPTEDQITHHMGLIEQQPVERQDISQSIYDDAAVGFFIPRATDAEQANSQYPAVGMDVGLCSVNRGSTNLVLEWMIYNCNSFKQHPTPTYWPLDYSDQFFKQYFQDQEGRCKVFRAMQATNFKTTGDPKGIFGNIAGAKTPFWQTTAAQALGTGRRSFMTNVVLLFVVPPSAANQNDARVTMIGIPYDYGNGANRQALFGKYTYAAQSDLGEPDLSARRWPMCSADKRQFFSTIDPGPVESAGIRMLINTGDINFNDYQNHVAPHIANGDLRAFPWAEQTYLTGNDALVPLFGKHAHTANTIPRDAVTYQMMERVVGDKFKAIADYKKNADALGHGDGGGAANDAGWPKPKTGGHSTGAFVAVLAPGYADKWVHSDALSQRYLDEAICGLHLPIQTTRNVHGREMHIPAGQPNAGQIIAGPANLNTQIRQALQMSVMEHAAAKVGQKYEYQLRALFEYGNETLVMAPEAMPKQLTNIVASGKPPGIF